MKHHQPFQVEMLRWTMLVKSRYAGIIFGYNVIGQIVAYDILKKCRSEYHYMLRSLKKEREKNIKVAISKHSLD